MAGATGSGKTNFMLNLLKKKMLNYSSVYVYSSTLYQPAYKHLKDFDANIEKYVKQRFNKTIRIGHFLDADEDIIDPSELSTSENHIMIFDDVMLTDQTKIKDYFCRGTPNNVNVFYLCQSLHKLSKHCIRENANIFILFRQDDKTLKYFHETHISGDIDFKEFKIFCDDAWTKKHGYIVVNLWDESFCGRYWANYSHVYTPEKYIK